MSTFFLLGNQHMYAQAQIGNGKPAPGGDVIDTGSSSTSAQACPSGSTYGCLEVGLPGNSDFSAGSKVDAIAYAGTPIRDLVNLVVKFALAILVIIGVITEWIMSALLGIFIAFISVVLLNTINPFLGKNAVEPSLGPVGSGAPGGG
ncbi:MAG: hypothetical protein K8Q97_02770 [Candidatus Andersenbacteria bacterium]|nr:hypothetical protein [Candidatus Andersenbacteria bacterium]